MIQSIDKPFIDGLNLKDIINNKCTKIEYCDNPLIKFYSISYKECISYYDIFFKRKFGELEVWPPQPIVTPKPLESKDVVLIDTNTGFELYETRKRYLIPE